MEMKYNSWIFYREKSPHGTFQTCASNQMCGRRTLTALFKLTSTQQQMQEPHIQLFIQFFYDYQDFDNCRRENPAVLRETKDGCVIWCVMNLTLSLTGDPDGPISPFSPLCPGYPMMPTSPLGPPGPGWPAGPCSPAFPRGPWNDMQ